MEWRQSWFSGGMTWGQNGARMAPFLEALTMNSSKLNLRLPEDLRVQAQALAERNGLSLNALCVLALRSHVDWQSGKVPPRLIASMNRANGRPASALSSPVHAEMLASTTVVPRVGANQPCPCGSGEKYKRCHGSARGKA